jgi:hypothetical protein
MRTSVSNENHGASTADCANIVICDFLRPALSADDRRIGMLNSAFEPVLAIFRLFPGMFSVLRTKQDRVSCLRELCPRTFFVYKKTPA